MTDPTATSTPVALQLDAEDLRSRVQRALDDFLDRQARLLGELGPECVPLVEAASRLVSGGKRLRPAFCYWAWRGAGGDDGEAVVRAATALELFQAAALIHDDVMDRSDTRRGMPAVHRQFAALHRGRAWSGDADGFGTAGAILAGDLCLGWSDEMIAASGLPADALARGKPVFDRMRTQLMAGQYLDVMTQAADGGRPAPGPRRGGGEDPVDRALRVVRYKSAKYTAEHPLLLGGAFAGADDALMAAYSAFGLPVGEAFQLRDDVLGVFGDPTETGKPAGDDLREGKRTVLVAVARRDGTAAQVRTLGRLLGDPRLRPVDVEQLREVIVDSGALDVVERMIDARVEAARELLDAAPVTPPARQVLLALADAATARRA